MPVIRSLDAKPGWVRWSGLGIGVVTDAPGFDRHFHDADEYWLVFEGRARIMSEGQEYVIGPGDVVCTRMGDEHDVLEILESPLRAFYIEDELHGQRRPGHLHRAQNTDE